MSVCFDNRHPVAVDRELEVWLAGKRNKAEPVSLPLLDVDYGQFGLAPSGGTTFAVD